MNNINNISSNISGFISSFKKKPTEKYPPKLFALKILKELNLVIDESFFETQKVEFEKICRGVILLNREFPTFFKTTTTCMRYIYNNEDETLIKGVTSLLGGDVNKMDFKIKFALFKNSTDEVEKNNYSKKFRNLQQYSIMSGKIDYNLVDELKEDKNIYYVELTKKDIVEMIKRKSQVKNFLLINKRLINSGKLSLSKALRIKIATMIDPHLNFNSAYKKK